jgi:hypothetical protein
MIIFFANYAYNPPPFNSVILQRLVFFLNMDDMEGAYDYLYSIKSDFQMSAALEEAIHSNLFYTPHQKETAIEYIKYRLGAPGEKKHILVWLKNKRKK